MIRVDEKAEVIYERDLNGVLLEVRKLLLGKHRDYGTSNLKEFGLWGILARLNDKKNRIKNLLEKDDDEIAVKEETLRDTFVDIAGYALQALLMIDGSLEQEVQFDRHHIS